MLNPPFNEAELLLGIVVIRILLEVALRRRLFQFLRQRRTARFLQLFQLAAQRVLALFSQISFFCCHASFFRLHPLISHPALAASQRDSA